MIDFSCTARVYYEDTDAGGVVYYANYLKYLERCRTEWLRDAGIDQSHLRATRSIQFVVRRCEIDYVAPAQLDDVLRLELSLTRWGGAKIDLLQLVFCDQQLLVQARVVCACVDVRSLRPQRLPRHLQEWAV